VSDLVNYEFEDTDPCTDDSDSEYDNTGRSVARGFVLGFLICAIFWGLLINGMIRDKKANAAKKHEVISKEVQP
jgi:hypothetical protein